MSDVSAIEGWRPKYEAWRETSMPMVLKGEAKKAFASYPWFIAEGDPFVRLERPAREARFAVVTTGGHSIGGVQEPFVPFPGFDDKVPGIREIPLDMEQSKLRIDHPGYDHRFSDEDVNVNLPLDRIAELVKGGEIGSTAQEVQVIMGLQPNVEPLLAQTVPDLIQRFRSDSVEGALLVPS